MQNLNTINEITSELDFQLMWYKWMTIKCPSAKEIYEFNNKNKHDQEKYLRSIFNV